MREKERKKEDWYFVVGFHMCMCCFVERGSRERKKGGVEKEVTPPQRQAPP